MKQLNKFLLLLLLFFIPLHLSAKEFRILTEEFPPYNYKKNDKVVGISVEITREILKRLGSTENIELMLWSKAYQIAKNNDNTILFSTTRTPAREKLFKWVGPLVPNNTALFAKASASFTINSLEDAKKVKGIGVYSDDFGELLLKSKGFVNLDPVVDNTKNLTKLANGVVDLWIINELTGKHMIREAGFSSQLKKVFDVQKDYMYLAFSLSTPDSVIEQWQTVLDEIKSDGTYAQIFSNWIMFSYSADLKPQQSSIVKLSKEEKQWIKEHPVVRVAPDPDYAPFQYFDINGQSQGLANDYLSLVSNKLGIHFEMVETDSWNASLEHVKQRNADMVLVAAKTAEREKFMSFTSAYVEFPDVIITRKNSPRVTSIVELEGKTLATIDGFAINDYVKKYYPNIKLSFKPDVVSVLESVSMGENDAAVINVATASNAIEQENITNLRIDGDTGFTYQLSFASRNDWPILNSLLEKALNSISVEERKKMLRKWISIAYNLSENKGGSVSLTSKEKNWLKNHPIITLAPDSQWAPVEFFNDAGKYSGMSADYVALLEKKLGIKFHVLRLDSWDEILKKSIDNEVDIITAAKTPNREKKLLFTDTYLTLPSVIIVNNKEQRQLTMKDLKGKTVAVVAGYAIQEYMEREFPDIKLEEVASAKEGLQYVSYGSAYAFIGGIATTSNIIEKEVLLNLRVAGEAGYSWKLSFATHKSSPILNQILSKGLAAISKKERQDIFSKWILVNKESWKPSKELIITLLIIVVILFIISIMVWNRMLIRRVAIRTIELNKTLQVSEELREKADNAQHEAENANRAKSEFLASMSHEIRTPMNAIIGMTSLIANTELTDKQKDYVNLVKNAGDNLLTIINDILDLSKIESGNLILETVPYDLQDVIKNVHKMMSVKTHEKGLKLTYLIEKNVPILLSGDSTRLRQVLINLIGNGIKFTSSGGIILHVKKDPDYENNSMLCFSVADTGIGISKDKAEIIFDSFSQADSSTTRKYGGTGLGLAISKKLVNKLGGKIWVEPNPGGGSKFFFTIKTQLQSEECNNDLPLSKHSEKETVLKKVASLNILLVDDDPVNLKVATIMLEELNHRVSSASDGKKAIEAYEANNFDLIFMDVTMHEMDGYETTRMIREREQKTNQHIPIVALTALAFKDDKQKCLDSGMDSYVSKPFRSENLVEAINDFFVTEDKKQKASPICSDNEIIDKEAVLARSGNDWDSLKMIADIYFNHSEELLVKLEKAIADRDGNTIGIVAHTMKGSLGTLGSIKAFESALILEKAGKNNELNEVETLYNTLLTDVKDFNNTLIIFMKEGQK
ncbi:MAG: transporter substrate-binding domain-containing protein [Gammaproteobacteria bacterium]|nr:transporter substrate-binding domain-containing protein [Gammaproteobacteria bacterium]